MPTFHPLRILLPLLSLCAITAYCMPFAQQGDDFVATVTVATVTIQPTQASLTAGAAEPTAKGLLSYLPEPDRRGTMDIILSCVVTLFLCIWTTVAINIEPVIKPGKAGWIAAIDRLLADRSVRKVGWSLTSLMVPEATMTIAAYEMCTARLLRRAMQKTMQARDAAAGDRKESDDRGPKSEVRQQIDVKQKPEDWMDLKLPFYAVMGGFRVVYQHDREDAHAEGAAPAQEGQQEEPRFATEPEGSQAGNNASSGTNRKQKHTCTANGTYAKSCSRQAGFLSNIKYGTKKKCPWFVKDLYTGESAGTLTPHGVLWMAERGWLPLVSPDFVDDKSKVDALAKILVCFQAFWMIMQAIGRVAANQPVTLLELHTVLHVVCAGTMYTTWFKKPVDIDLPTEIFLTYEQFDELRRASQVTDDLGDPNPTNPFSRGKIGTDLHPGERDSKYVTTRAGLGKLMYQQLSNGRNVFLSFTALGRAFDRIIRGRANLVWEGALLCTVGLIYGGVHLATWNNYFVSAFERHAWRACSIVTAVAVLGFVLELCIGALIRFIDPETSIKPFTSESKTQRQPQPSTGREKVAGNGTQQSAREPVEKNAEIIEATTPHEHEHDSATTPAAKSEAARNDPRKRDTWSWRAYRLVVAVTVFFGFIVVMFTRCFLLVESFIALRKQPDGVYDTINWVQTVPHVAK